MRKDGKPLTPKDAEAIWMYHSHILDLFGDGPEAAHRQINRANFERYLKNYKK